MKLKEERLEFASTHSQRVSLESVRSGEAGLNQRRTKLLDRVPSQSDYARFPHDSVEILDLAYLTAATGDEFALLRGKNEDILYHGIRNHCQFFENDSLYEMLMMHKLYIVAHSHPVGERPVPSGDDRRALAIIGQRKSYVVSAVTGFVTEYTSDRFDSVK